MAIKKEAILQYVWKQTLYNNSELKTTDGQIVTVVHHGEFNHDAGPDFFNAKIQIGDTLWAGNVEIHLLSSDWKKHGHHNDSLYDSVVLHVVEKNDENIVRTNGTQIPTVELVVSNDIVQKVSQFNQNEIAFHCFPYLKELNPFLINMWLERLIIERLEYKTTLVHQLLIENTNDWEKVFYCMLARSLGSHINAQAFEMLLRSLPLNLLSKHKDSVFQLEALLFGQAGMLSEQIDDEYYRLLQNEYTFLKSKYTLEPIPVYLWKFMRIRPVNFPTIRIAQLVQLIHHSSSLFSKIIEAKNVKMILHFFQVDTSVYWLTHYSFGKSSTFRHKQLGEATVYSIIINAVIPILFLYGKMHGKPELTDNAIDFLSMLPAEENDIVKKWNERGVKCKDAGMSQALIQLQNHYCNAGKCLQCAIGDAVFRNILNSGTVK